MANNKKITNVPTPSQRHPSTSILTAMVQAEPISESVPIPEMASNNAATESGSTNKEKNKGGRPKKENKKKQYSLTMDPFLYKEVMEFANKKRTSFSQIMTNAILDYMEQNNE